MSGAKITSSDAAQAEIDSIERSVAKHNGGELVKSRPDAWDNQQLQAINSFDDLAAAINSRDDVVTANATDFGSGYTVLDDKRKLIGVEFAMLDYRVHPGGDFGSFSSMLVLTRAGDKYIVNDGSTGIHEQLMDIDKMRDEKNVVVYFPNGLRVSDYEYTDIDRKTGEEVTRPASTFYLAY